MLCYAKSLQSCPTLCKPIDGSPPGSPIRGILQARTLEWAAISFSNEFMHIDKFKGNRPSMLQQIALFCSFYGQVIFHCIYVLHLLYSFIWQWIFKLLLNPGYCKICYYEQWGACTFLNYGFLWEYAQ